MAFAHLKWWPSAKRVVALRWLRLGSWTWTRGHCCPVRARNATARAITFWLWRRPALAVHAEADRWTRFWMTYRFDVSTSSPCCWWLPAVRLDMLSIVDGKHVGRSSPALADVIAPMTSGPGAALARSHCYAPKAVNENASRSSKFALTATRENSVHS